MYAPRLGSYFALFKLIRLAPLQCRMLLNQKHFLWMKFCPFLSRFRPHSGTCWVGLYQPVSVSTRLFPLLPCMGHLYRGEERNKLCSPGMQVRSRTELWPHWNSLRCGSLAGMVFTLQWNNQSNSWYLILNSCDFELYWRKTCNSC